MSKELNLAFEKAVRFLVKYFPPSDEKSRKPIMFHDIRVGVYLYENGYSDNIVLAGILHDVLEWSNADEEMLKQEFGEDILRLVLANTKDNSVVDKEEKIKELIRRCIENGQEALVIKAADIMDSFKWYSSQNNENELQYCIKNADAIFKFKPESFDDKIFNELKNLQENLLSKF